MKNGRYINMRGEKEWYKDGKLHRDEGLPAIIGTDGDEWWYINGKCHRDNGPAVIYKKSEHWYINGERHRDNGPAIEYMSGDKCWYVNGGELTEVGYKQWLRDKRLTQLLDG